MDAKAFNLGWCCALVNERGVLRIVSPSDDSEGFHSPAQSVCIARPQDIELLKQACEYALAEKDKF